MRVANIFPVWVLFFHSDINILKILNILKYVCIWLHWVLAAAFEIFHLHCSMRFPGGSDGKASVYNVGDLGSIPGSGRFPGEGNGNPLQYSCLENPMDGGAWCRLLSMGSQRVGHDWVTSLHLLWEADEQSHSKFQVLFFSACIQLLHLWLQKM